MWIRGRRTCQVIAASASVAILLAACSSSKSTASNSGSTTATPTSTSSAPADASPILIGSSGSLTNPAFSEPELIAGLNAAVTAINAAGGVKGHPLKLDFCDSAYDVSKELSCARTLVKDKVVAVVHPSIFADSSGAEFKLYSDAKIALFGGYGVNPFELTDSNSYPLSSGLVGWVYSAAKAVKDAGATKVSVIVDTNPPSQYFGKLAVDALKALGYQNVNVVTGDQKNDPTFATVAAKASSNGTNGILIGTGPVAFPAAVRALKQGGYTGKIGVISATMEKPILKALGSYSEGMLVGSQLAFVTDTANPGIAKFLDDMKAQPASTIDDLSLAAWSAVELFAKIMETSTAATLDATAFNAALAGLSTPIDIGTIGPYAVAGVTSPLSSFPRILNATAQVGTVRSGAIVPDGKGFINPFTN